ncbi:hypothetical protein FITA111629_15685 [Filibacter tadaridae]|uniref:Uncharacterized protein n=1 Tax=Filibacter tadaridae TaxID=2483811 RepID=A0A3P5XFY9_9BACL|nr:hypothetical protein FILTAD_02982 [Filibacter tadaridae]
MPKNKGSKERKVIQALFQQILQGKCKDGEFFSFNIAFDEKEPYIQSWIYTSDYCFSDVGVLKV